MAGQLAGLEARNLARGEAVAAFKEDDERTHKRPALQQILELLFAAYGESPEALRRPVPKSMYFSMCISSPKTSKIMRSGFRLGWSSPSEMDRPSRRTTLRTDAVRIFQQRAVIRRG